jgi:hypothetical protein
MALEQELTYFQQHLPEWLSVYPGQFAVIKGDQLLGTFTTFDEAFAAGVKAYGTEPFLIRQVAETAPVAYNPALSVGALYAHL